MSESSRKSNTGEKYIYLTKTRSGKDSYRVRFDKSRRSLSKSFKSLNDAIKYRDQIVAFSKKNRRLPNDSELENIFGLRLYTRSHRKSDDLTNDLMYIRYFRKTNRYFVCINRERVRFNTSFKTLEEAKLARKIVLETYEETGRMLRVGEVRARMRELGELK